MIETKAVRDSRNKTWGRTNWRAILLLRGVPPYRLSRI